MRPRFKIQYPMKNRGKDADNPIRRQEGKYAIRGKKKAKVETLARINPYPMKTG